MPNPMPNYQKAYRIGTVNEQRGDEQRGSAEPLFRKDECGDLFLTEKDWQEAKQKGAFNVVYFERLSRSRLLAHAAGGAIIEYPLPGTFGAGRADGNVSSWRTHYQ